MWLPVGAAAHLAGATVRVVGQGPLFDAVRAEADAAGLVPAGDGERAQVEIALVDAGAGTEGAGDGGAGGAAPGPQSFVLERRGGVTTVAAGDPHGALYGWFELVRRGPAALGDDFAAESHAPAHAVRMLDHWDNMVEHDVMGKVERGYAGGSIFFGDGRIHDDLSRVARYARLLAAIGVDRIAINNVNVHEREARLIVDDVDDLARIADVLRPWGIRLHVSVDFAAPVTVGGLPTADPLDAGVGMWWSGVVDRLYRAIPDFGGFVVKADSEGRPGPFAYGRDHADGANVLARALAPHGGIVHWRAFVYDHRQDWRDRSTDRARAAFDHFTPIDGRFEPNVVLQVKHGPMDFQTREPVSPVIAAMTRTPVALELQVTQEYTGQQRHAVYLAPWWREILDFAPFGDDGPTLDRLLGGGAVAVSNVGDDGFSTGHPLAQANLYAFGRLAWDPRLDPAAILDEWIALTFGADADPGVRAGIHAILDDSWRVYESYTAPLGVGFMVVPGSHYGPDPDGYEYSPWGTYHFADRDGVGVDRSVATGTGFAGQYPEPWASRYESPATTPDELLLFFHHVPYDHVLRSGATVIGHIYDSHIAGAEAAERMRREWDGLAGLVPDDLFARAQERFAEQARSAAEWRDVVTTYFRRKSGVADPRVIP